MAIHEPVAVQAQQVEPVEALEQAHQVGSVSEVRLLIFTELIETNVASAFNWIIECCHELDQIFVQIVQNDVIFLSLEVVLRKHVLDLFLHHFLLVVVEAFREDDFEVGRLGFALQASTKLAKLQSKFLRHSGTPVSKWPSLQS